MGSGARSTGSAAVAAMEEYRPVVNTLPEVAQLLLGQERHCQGLLDVLQPDQTQGPQVVSVCGAPGAGGSPSQRLQPTTGGTFFLTGSCRTESRVLMQQCYPAHFKKIQEC